jgi:C4-dicarboxylate-specific signal transduction histidine kinase
MMVLGIDQLKPDCLPLWSTAPEGRRWLPLLEARHGLPILLVFGALCATLALRELEHGRPPLFLFCAAIGASAWFGGLTAGTLAVFLSLPAGAYFYHGSLGPRMTDDVVLLVIFVICAAMGRLLSARQRAVQEKFQTTHQQLEVKARRLQAMNTALVVEMAKRRRIEQALQDAQTRLSQVSRLTTLGELAATIAHEVNQPLTAVATNAGSCLQWLHTDPPNVREAIKAAERVARDSTRASDVIARIRGLLRRGSTEKSLVDLNATIEDVLTFIQSDIRKNQITVRMSLDPDLPTFPADRVQMQQVLVNLFMNAVEAMGSVPQDRRLLEISTAHQADNLLVTISDGGEGLAPDVADRIFDAFVTTKPLGMGLGLTICRSIIDAHGGKLAVWAGTLHGTTFRIQLPQFGAPQ